eukprot:1036673_1
MTVNEMGNTTRTTSDPDGEEKGENTETELNTEKHEKGAFRNKNSYLHEEFKDQNKMKWKVDSSAIGSSGLFWRIAPSMYSVSPECDWPRNGSILYGWKSTKNTGWIKVDHPNFNHWLPIKQRSKTVLHLQQ